ncbi:MFS transporter [Salinarimonas soli]|uniref:MFS transporter n=1 Tax=Salinarimonas soli TaxID=1638099 RepID=A0A5B2V9P1_9HYPH|nr:MFS transporter [Salinarimonas soli]KAA2235150.1 MFS transporter [Salinarimonas soli]
MNPSDAQAGSVRRIIIVLAVAGFASTFTTRTADPMVTVIASDLGSQPKTIALLATAFALPYALIQLILGPVGDALGKIRVMRVCLVVLALALVASAFVRNAETLFALRVVCGAAAGGVIPLCLAMLGDRVPMERRQVAISRFLVAVIAAQLLGASVAGILVGWIGWRGVFIVCAGLVFASTGALLTGAVRGGPPTSPFSIPVAIARYRAFLANPRARALFSFVFVEGVAVFGIFPFIATLLEAEKAGGPTEAGLALSAFAIGGLIFSALVAWMLRTLGTRVMLSLGGVVCAAGLLLIGFAHDWRVYAAAMLGIGLGFYMLHNTYQVNVTELNPQARASAVAVHACFFFLGAAAGPVITGLGLAWIGRGPTLAIEAAMVAALGFVSARILTARRA